MSRRSVTVATAEAPPAQAIVLEPQTGAAIPQVGERIRRLRLQRGMSQSELAGGRLTKGFISQVESGRSHPSADSLRFIASRLAVPLTALMPGVELSQQQAFLLRAAESELGLGNASAAQTHLDEVEPLLTSPRERSWHLRMRGEARLLQSRADEAVEDGLLAFDLVATADAPEEATRACNLLGKAHHVAGRLPAALLYFDRAAAFAEHRSVGPVLRAMIHSNRGTTHMRLGDLAHALEAYDAARASAEDAEDLKQLAIAHMGLGEAARQRGDLPSAIASAERAVTLLERIELRQLQTQILHNIGDAYADLGDREQARAHQERALRAGRAMKDPYTVAHILDRLAVLDISDGNLEAARSEVTESIALARELHIADLLCRALTTAAEAAEASGDRRDADRLFAEAHTAGDSAGPNERRQMMLREGTVRRARGELAEALACFEAAARLAI
ncbi:MAG TPA: tetratricopeptide repeat protein [Candidatus Dormibacteraeota bacterium]|nr:tetratricopeptide repeat protein [Candidatus Dormibacteraeota bacterium]